MYVAVRSSNLVIRLESISLCWNTNRSSRKKGSNSARAASGILHTRRVVESIIHQVLHNPVNLVNIEHIT